jgi:hypothetical protein
MLAARRALIKSSASLIPPGNLITAPVDFNNALHTLSNCTMPYAGTAPDGSYTASKMTENGASSTHSFGPSTAVVSGVRYLHQFYIKSLGLSRYLCIAGGGTAASGEMACFNPDTGNVDYGATSTNILRDSGCSMQLIGNGWYRCRAHVLTSSTGAWSLMMTNNNTTNTFTGYQGDSASGLLVWGWHVKQA